MPVGIRVLCRCVCEQCGFTSAAFRPEVARAHQLENPDCEGVIRIIFRSEDRYRDPASTAPAAGPPPEGLSTEERRAPGEGPGRTFTVREALDPDGTVRLTLVGDLDLAAADVLGARLAEPKTTGRPTRLDVPQLAFIDSAGIQALLVALTDARWDGWPLEVAPELSPSVQRAAEIVGIAQVLRPQDPDRTRASTANLRPASTA